MACGIYKITNKINGHSYIGQSVNIIRRWGDHRHHYNNLDYDCTLYKAFRKYGLENFEFEIIEECEPELLDEKEEYYIKLYDTFKSGYNSTVGGQTPLYASIEPLYVEQVRYELANTEISQKDLSKKYQVTNQMISDINCGIAWRKSGIEYPIRKRHKQIYLCPCCGKQKSNKGILCEECYKKSLTTNRPEPEELAKKVYYSSFSAAGREFGVSGNTIANWCKSYGIPSKIKELKAWYEENYLN